jgi:hypothetical protein
MHILSIYMQAKMNREISMRQKEGSNGQDKDKSACKGGQKIYHMSLMRAKGAVSAQEGAQLF